MSIIRVQRKEKWTTVSNVHINDSRLSWKATAILTYLLSKPNDWTVYVKQLATAKKDGIKSVYSGIRELKELGYIEHIFIRDEDGKMKHGEYVVYEEPREIETPVNTYSEPYAQNGNTVNGNADNGTLLNTDYIKDGFKENTDDVPAPPPPDPKPIQKETPPKPSSSFSENDFIKTVATLMSLVPEKYQKPSVEKVIKKSLKEHTETYIRFAILYTISHSNGGTWQKFKAYLGKSIDNHYHDGWGPENLEGTQADIEAAKKQQEEADRETRKLEEAGAKIDALLVHADVQSLDDFIGNQNLSRMERQRFNQDKRDMLRRHYVLAFLKQ